MSVNRAFQSSGIFLDDDINIVKAAYDGVLSTEQDPYLRVDEVARYVLKMYDRGVVDPGKLERLSTLYFRTKLRVG
ncbi:hypothetical protein G6L32_26085 [Agrobacterium tumefaciens]|uniref:hypothetical protein n=1 Tax=Agrobacterium TaxID=357 RepID=UPI000FDF2202|nr:hypothetical protein [Agrobacterium sp. RS6]NSZ77117.1 hypothetical protein [Agrobacterium tumefaciens]NTA13551.1 hypothetical protein [Agrobacterium tumefaciens]NTA62097.1 hypothetical protein [Agrobacterium tumefaciens]NTZ63750.1 hypothetical protein [Agrobacterium tumefaciens]UXR94993.1 hypothetical protein FY157_25080 [Agrobacterium tumefaciens]